MAQSKHIPIRTCVGCRGRFPKLELLRFARNTERRLVLDNQGRLFGRGAYVCKEIACLQKAIKSKSFSRTLRSEVIIEDPEVFLKTVQVETEQAM